MLKDRNSAFAQSLRFHKKDDNCFHSTARIMLEYQSCGSRVLLAATAMRFLVVLVACYLSLGFMVSAFARSRSGTLPCFSNQDCPPDSSCVFHFCENFLHGKPELVCRVGVLRFLDLTRYGTAAGKTEKLAQQLADMLSATRYISATLVKINPLLEYADYRRLSQAGYAYLIWGRIVAHDSNYLTLEIKLYSVLHMKEIKGPGGEFLIPTKNPLRGLANIASDLLVYFTGKPGVAGKRIAMIGKTSSRTKEIFVTTYGATNFLQQITFDGSLALFPAWTADGRIAYTSFKQGRPKIFVQGADKPFCEYDGMNSSVDWSPDGSVATVTLSIDGNPEIYLVDGTTGDLRARLTFNPGVDTSATWSPDGSTIAFVSDRSGTPQIYLMNMDGTGVRRVTVRGIYNTSPDWHPFAPYLVYTGRAGSRFQIFILNLKDLTTYQLTHGPGDCEDGSWSPDGSLIAFSCSTSSKSVVYVSRPDGSDMRALTPSNGFFFSPVWEK